MKVKQILKILGFLCPIIFIVTQYLPYTSGFWDKVDQKEVIINLLSLYFLFLGALLYFEMQDSHKDSMATLSSFGAHLRDSVAARLISDKEFYEDFLVKIKNATSLVCISYFAPYPPDATKHKDRDEYYKDIKKIIKKKADVKFRRIVRDTPDNRVWVKKIIEDFEGVPNFDLALIDDSCEDKMPYTLSVQIIDKKHSWLVAIESHEKEGLYRDLYLGGDSVGDALQGYFLRLWKLSDEVITSGVLTTLGNEIKNS